MRRAALAIMLCVSAAARAVGTVRLPVLRADGVRVEFTVEVARSAEERRVGLMERRGLAPRTGMLFVFPRSGSVTMWMKDTPMSLDMLFLDDDGRVAWLAARTTPESTQLISPPRAVRYVVEIGGGEAADLSLGVGDRALLDAAGLR